MESMEQESYQDSENALDGQGISPKGILKLRAVAPGLRPQITVTKLEV